jgi:hypothetical protein
MQALACGTSDDLGFTGITRACSTFIRLAIVLTNSQTSHENMLTACGRHELVFLLDYWSCLPIIVIRSTVHVMNNTGPSIKLLLTVTNNELQRAYFVSCRADKNN